MTNQQEADCLLGIWQRSRDLPPEQRLEKLFLDFFSPVPPGDVEYAAILRNVAIEMSYA